MPFERMQACGTEQGIVSRAGPLSRPVAVRLLGDRLVRGEGEGRQVLTLAWVSRLHLDTARPRGPRLIVEGIDNRRIVIRPGPGPEEAAAFAAFCETLMAQVPRFNPFVTYAIGPTVTTWLGASLALLVTLGVVVALARAALSGAGVATGFLPLALAPAALGLMLPVLLAGPCRNVEPDRLRSALAVLRLTAG
jgi:hypothetical protein